MPLNGVKSMYYLRCLHMSSQLEVIKANIIGIVCLFLTCCLIQIAQKTVAFLLKLFAEADLLGKSKWKYCSNASSCWSSPVVAVLTRYKSHCHMVSPT